MDPIDGTMNFVHKYSGFTVSVGVLHQQQPVVGVIYEVYNDKMYWAVKGKGAFCNGYSLAVSNCSQLEKCLLLTEVRPSTASYQSVLRNN